ncbi:hypothetical protein GCM10018793_55840 [Streptomyces sulfonofaciens]|uniref:PucR C-terminal helix-turn-helix domain-containing protein n=1 Tax=Streptomyces sulfonofaciens TaxID=68272 RepID=A0A919GJW4_9ACTN|nr:helix-turn-helix domain-containing protein [Streptomyces sulfonofaciens]GHH85939.1 hypothetical protein GCM10018793_55840 [Streptomyces sulfonofaciens]
MKDLVGRLSALDPDAGAAVKVIAYFDQLVDGRAGLEAIVRGAAVLSGCVVRLVDDERHVRVRVGPEGHAPDDGFDPPEPEWLNAPLVPGGPPVLWLERPGPAGPVDAMVLERAVSAARGVLDRTRGRASGDPALMEVVLDASAEEATRTRAARRLGLPGTARVLALDGGAARIEATGAVPGRGRVGVGPMVPVLDLPASWEAARTALRFAADGTEQDPGARVVHADELGGLAVLAAAVAPGTKPVADVLALERARSAAPWVLGTLVTFVSSPSLRTAATALVVHHSTLQDRIAHAEQLLGWPVRDPPGRLRLQLALALRRLHLHT